MLYFEVPLLKGIGEVARECKVLKQLRRGSRKGCSVSVSDVRR